MSTSYGRFVEQLEGRQLFAAQPVELTPGQVLNPWLGSTPTSRTAVTAPVSVALPAAEAKPAQAAINPAPVVAGKRPVDLKGDWSGTIRAKILFVKRKVDFDLKITAQTINSITGSIEIDGREYDGTFIGRINPKTGRFKYALKGEDDITISGQLSKSGRTIGGGSVKAEYLGFKVKGSFRLDRPA